MLTRLILACVLLVAVPAIPAFAAPGVNLRWNDCFGDGGASNRNFACDTDAGSSSLRGSFVLGAGMSQVNQLEAVVHLATASPIVPGWWEFKNPGACRRFALTIAAFDGTNCFDWAGGQASMNLVSYERGLIAPFTARLEMYNIVTGPAMDLSSATEYTAFALNISHAGTVGTTCTGCQVPACIAAVSITLTTSGGTETELSSPTNAGDSFYVSWQGGQGVFVPGTVGCYPYVPVRNTTWSAVKSLYR